MIRVPTVTCFIAVTFCFFFAALPLKAVEQITAPGSDGRPFFVFDIYQYGEQPPSWEGLDVTPPSDWPISSAIKRGIAEAAGYWVRLLGPGARNTGPFTISVSSINEDNAYGYSPQAEGGHTALSRPIITGDASDGGALAMVLIGDTDGLKTYETGPARVLPANGEMENLQSGTVLHELGHALGIGSGLLHDASRYGTVPEELSLFDKHLYNEEGQQYQPGQTILWDKDAVADLDDYFLVVTERDESGAVWDGALYFRGENSLSVLNGAILLKGQPGLPINAWEPMPEDEDEDGNLISALDANHIELRNSLMSHQTYRNYGVLMEAELALLQDIGYELDRKNFFGSSEYRDAQTYNNMNGYFARSHGQYQPGLANTAQLGIGFHIYGIDNNITQAADLLADGWGGVGARIDGWNNTFTVAQGTRVTANGAEGTGLMLAYGRDHNIKILGEITALGPNGVAARFDFGSNLLSHLENRGSYIHQYWDYEDEKWHDASVLHRDLDGPLVENFDVSGTLAGSAAAIFISENAYVKNINITRGARLFGDIISRWDPYSDMFHSDYTGVQNELTTALTFGQTPNKVRADAEPFFLDYRGNIIGPQSLNVRLADGALAYGGTMDVLSFTAESEAALLLAASGSRIKADSITLNGQVGLADNTVSYGAPLPSQWDLLRLESDAVIWKATLQDAPKNFIHGFHDYTGTSLEWDDDKAALILGSTHTLSQERAAVSALTAPTAIALQAPYVDLIRNSAQLRPLKQTSPASSSLWTTPAHSLWFTPAYGYSQRQGSHHYTLNSPGFALGADRSRNWAHDPVMGVGAYFSAPAYRSDNADIDAKSATAFIYGAKESLHGLYLDAFAALGRTFYEQRRSVHGEQYNTDYAGSTVSAGLSLNKFVPILPGIAATPFASYNFTRVNVDGYNEGDAGLFGLKVGQSRSDLHRVEAGSSFAFALEKGFVEGKAFYSGLYGDREPEVKLSMTRDPSGYSLNSQGWAQDKHSIGLGLNVNLDMGKQARFSGGYTFVGGPNVQSHQAEMNFSVAF